MWSSSKTISNVVLSIHSKSYCSHFGGSMIIFISYMILMTGKFICKLYIGTFCWPLIFQLPIPTYLFDNFHFSFLRSASSNKLYFINDEYVISSNDIDISLPLKEAKPNLYVGFFQILNLIWMKGRCRCTHTKRIGYYANWGRIKGVFKAALL